MTSRDSHRIQGHDKMDTVYADNRWPQPLNVHSTWQKVTDCETLRLYRPTTIRTARRNLSTAKRYGCTGPPQSTALLAGTCQQPNATAVPAHHNPQHCTQEPVNSQTLRLYRPTTIRTARRNLSTAKRYGCTGPPQSVLLAGTCQQPNDFSPSGAEIKLAYVWAVGAGYSLCWLDRISFNFRQWAPNGTSEQFVELYNSYRWVDCVCVCVCVCVCACVCVCLCVFVCLRPRGRQIL